MFKLKFIKLWARIKHGEYRYLFKRIFRRGNPIFYGGIQVVFKLTDIDKFGKLYSIVNKQCDHEVYLVDTRWLNGLCSAFPNKEKKFRSRFDKGCLCYIAVKNNRITAYLWALEAKDQFDTNSLWKLKPETMDGIWCFDGFVQPEYRMRGLFPFLMGTMREHYLKNGYVTQYGETDDRNEMSLNTHLRVGYSILWRVFFVSIFGLKIYSAHNPTTNKRKISALYAIKIDNLTL